MSLTSPQTDPGPSPLALDLQSLGQLVRKQRIACELSLLDAADAMNVDAVLLGHIEDGQTVDTDSLLTVLRGLGLRLLVMPTGDAEVTLRMLGHTISYQPAAPPNAGLSDAGTSFVLDETTPTLFVDFDGTLHVGRAFIDECNQITLDSGRRPMEFAPLLVELLEPYPDVEIVLTTSWLQKLSVAEVVSHLPLELAGRVVGTTRDIKPRMSYVLSGADRTYVIVSYAYGHRLKNWLAIDDAVFGASQFGREPGALLAHFLLLDSARGIGDAIPRQHIRRWLADVHHDRSF
ncbi:XRE family transcriptional regulator [Trinickia dinghuensis]|uniref:XRE family transcriptional regulator n=2 Tax=Trinickia dinghuensis TaxID=2291023 RepID=A0A3D8K0U8_9BURK|nr:XRE family transcriptional regulator [Trinickia dinghuensis]